MAEVTADAGQADLSRWLGERTFDDALAEYDERGFVIFPNVLDADALERMRSALAPFLASGPRGRNDFEGLRSNRVYAMLAKDPAFAELVLHPLAMGFAEHLLGPSLLLSACLAIQLHPSETAQPWHFDDAHFTPARPREAFGVSTFWAIDDCTDDNGATEVIPGSHRWDDGTYPGRGLSQDDFVKKSGQDVEVMLGDDDPEDMPDAVKAIMPAGSLMIAAGTLWHRGGSNRSEAPRTIVTPQYCPGWARQLENMVLAVPPDKAALLPERARELLGYSIHPPFMGYVDGRHPGRLVPEA